MAIFEHDPDVVRWGLHHLLDVCSPGNSGSPQIITRYDEDFSQVAYVKEGYCGNDEFIARAYQEELSRVAVTEGLESSSPNRERHQGSILAQDWLGSSGRHTSSGSPEIEDDSVLDGEVGKRLNQMCPVPHVPRINGEIPSADEATTDHQRLLDRLQLYDLAELKVPGDGNCQFRSLSDQIYRTMEHHKFVRQQVVSQLQSHPELYEGYVSMAYDEYLRRMNKNGEWGDHVTLQAAADSDIYDNIIQRHVLYRDSFPNSEVKQKDHFSNSSVITLSFWAEVHYNSIYTPGGLRTPSDIDACFSGLCKLCNLIIIVPVRLIFGNSKVPRSIPCNKLRTFDNLHFQATNVGGAKDFGSTSQTNSSVSIEKIALFQFGLGAKAHYVILELYAQGNVL